MSYFSFYLTTFIFNAKGNYLGHGHYFCNIFGHGKKFGPWATFFGPWPEKVAMAEKMWPMGKMVKYLLLFIFNRNVYGLHGQ